jgi:aminoglycoside 6'-N-acetyltransferase
MPVTRADLPMLGHWLDEPHVQPWWGPRDWELKLIEEELGQRPVDMRIVHHDSRPFAYVQDYPAHHWPMPQYADMPEGTRAVDTFLGDPAYLGQGHASGYLRQRARELLGNGYPAVVVDPSPDNVRALRAYRAAGFGDVAIRPCEDGDPVVVLRFAEDRR